MAETREWFSGTGYEQTWTEALAGSNTIDEDATASVAGLAVSDQVVAVDVQTVGSAGYTYWNTGTATVSYTRFRFAVTAESLGDDATAYLCWLWHDLADNIANVRLYQAVGGALSIRVFVKHDGGAGTVHDTGAYTVGDVVDVTIYWNTDADEYEVWRDGVSIATGSITSTPSTAPWEMTHIVIGNIGGTPSAAVYTFEVAEAAWSDTAYPSPHYGPWYYYQQEQEAILK